MVDLSVFRQLGKGKKAAIMNPDSANSLVLASASPRRLAILGQVGIEPDALRPTSIDETPSKTEPPRAYVARVAKEKAMAAQNSLMKTPNLPAPLS